MGDELAEVEGHIDARIGAAERLAVEINAECAVQLAAVPPVAQRTGCHENGGEGAGRFGLQEAEALGEFIRDEVAQRHVIGEADKPDVAPCLVRGHALRHVSGDDDDFRLHVAAPGFVCQRNGITRSKEAV